MAVDATSLRTRRAQSFVPINPWHRLKLPVRRPSPALIVASLALVLSVTGNAAAAVIIGSNAQVAAHTIAGANAPSGDHQNLIAGSVGTADLHPGAVTAADLAAGDRPHKLDLLVSGLGSSKKNVAIDELTLTGTCNRIGVTVGMGVQLSSSVGADLGGSWMKYLDGTAYPGGYGDQPQPAGGVWTIGGDVIGSGEFESINGQLIYRNNSRLITIAFSMAAVPDQDHGCEILATAVPASLK